MTKNSLSRVKGFAPSQWVLGKLPKESGSIMDEGNWADLGALTAADPTLELGRLQGSVRRPGRHLSEPTCPLESEGLS